MFGLDVSGGGVALLLGESFCLLLRVVDLGEGISQLDTPGEVLESLDERRILVRRARERRQLDRIVVEDRRLDQRRLDES